MGILFGKGTLIDRIKWAFKMAFNHGFFLTLLVISYKASHCVFTRIFRKNSPLIGLLAGAVSSRAVRQPFNKEFISILKQYAYYIVPRVLEGLFANFKKVLNHPLFEGFPVTYMLAWGCVMYMFEMDKSILNRSLVASMDYIYKGSDRELNSWWDLLPGV